MTMKRSFFQSSEIGVIDLHKSSALIFLILILSIVPGVSAYREDGLNFMTHYKYEDFVAFFELPEETEIADALYHTISVANLQESNISAHYLFENFPAYNIVREQPTNEEACFGKYVVYNLADKSALFIFIEDGILTNVCRMMPRCTKNEFSSIVQGVSTPCDVVGIDDNAVFNPFVQWGPVSYHCLDDDTFWRITYTQSDYSSEEFVVDGITMVPHNECLTILHYIYPDDMPFER